MEPQRRGRVCLSEHHRDAYPTGQLMTQTITGNCRLSLRATGALVFGAALLLSPAIFATEASAQALSYAPQSAFPSDNGLAPPAPALTDEGDGSASLPPERLRRAVVAYDTREAPGTVIIDTPNTALYYVLGQGRAVRYRRGVGRARFITPPASTAFTAPTIPGRSGSSFPRAASA